MGNAKGAVMLGPVKFLRKKRHEALEILPPEQHHYLDDEIRISAWYPEADFLALIRATAQLIAGPFEEVVEGIGAAGAQEHALVYGDLLSTLRSNSSVFALWSSQHDTGELRGVWDGPNAARVLLTGFDSPSDVVCLLSTGYIRGNLVANGYDDLAIEKVRCVLRGDPSCEWKVSWKDPEDAPVTPVRRRTR